MNSVGQKPRQQTQNGLLRLVFLQIFIFQRFFVEGIADKSSSIEGELTSLNRCNPDAEKAASRCLEPMLAYANAIQLADGKSGHRHFSIQGPQVFQRLCVLYAEFKECTAAVRCQSLSEQAVDASYGFMCGSGQAEFQQHADCFARVENRPDYIQCREQASDAMDRVADQQKMKATNDEAHQSQLCAAMADYLDCCRPPVERSCGHQAWALVARITRDSLRVSLPKCRLATLLVEGEDDAQ